MPRKIDGTERDLLKEIYCALVQSIIIYCISVWGGAAKTKFLEVERAQRGLIKVMYFKKRIFPTETLYHLTKLASVRKLYITHVVLRKHKSLPYNPSTADNNERRRKPPVAKVSVTNSTFASRQYYKRSAQLYNLLNKELKIYHKKYYDCKKAVSNWLQSKTYDETEQLLAS